MTSEPDKIRQLFIEHLNRLHCVKAHLVERLVDIAEENRFDTVKMAIDQTIADTEQQILSIDKLYDLLSATYSFDNCTALINFLENTFAESQQYYTDPYITYVLTLSYVHHIDCIEKASFSILKVLALKIGEKNIISVLNNISMKNTDAMIEELTQICVIKA